MEKVELQEKKSDSEHEDLRVKHMSGTCNTRCFWIITVFLGIDSYMHAALHAYL